MRRIKVKLARYRADSTIFFGGKENVAKISPIYRKFLTPKRDFGKNFTRQIKPKKYVQLRSTKGENIRIKIKQTHKNKKILGTGLEPVRPLSQRILSPLRLPFRHPSFSRLYPE